MLHFLFYLNSGGGLTRLMAVADGAQESRVVGGTHLVSERMAAALGDKVQLSAPVRTIIQHPDHVEVQFDGGSTTAQHVIVALPPVLAGRLRYDPPLPANRDSLTQQMPAGSVIKYQIGYETPFWRAKGLDGAVLSLDTNVGLVYDNCPPDNSCGVLVAFVEGQHARHFNELTPEQRQKIVIDDLVQFFGDAASEPFDVIEKNWSEEEYTRGCYGGRLGTNVWTQFGESLRAPVDRIHWAGSETSDVWNGYMDGAVRSGLRAAGEIAQKVALNTQSAQ